MTNEKANYVKPFTVAQVQTLNVRVPTLNVRVPMLFVFIIDSNRPTGFFYQNAKENISPHTYFLLKPVYRVSWETYAHNLLASPALLCTSLVYACTHVGIVTVLTILSKHAACFSNSGMRTNIANQWKRVS